MIAFNGSTKSEVRNGRWLGQGLVIFPSRHGRLLALAPARGHSCPMPLGFGPHHPGGITENSPTFQRWVREFRGAQVPKGRLKPGAIHQPSLRDFSCCGRWFPTLKLWAIIACPSGTKTWPGFAGVLWDQFLAALDIPVRSMLRKATRPCQFVNCITHRMFLRTGMSARRLGGSASIRGAGAVGLQRTGAFCVRGHEGAAGFGFRNSDLIRASDFGLRIWPQNSTEIAKEALP